ncbi:MAG: glycosyltransferase family 87 protein [Candidatus Aminicenantia bacterium]
MKSNYHSKIYAKWILSGIIIVLLILLFVFKISHEMTDFEVCYRAGKRILAGETLYQMADGHEQFKYPPFSAFFFSPLTFLPLSLAKGIWYFVVLFTYFISLYLSFRLLPEKRKKAGSLIFLTFLILTKFFGRELQLGQVNCLIILLLLIMIYQLLQGREGTSGLLWAGASIIKPYALVFFPYFVIKKRFKIVLFGLSFFILALFLPSIVYGIKGNLSILTDWRYTLSQTTSGLLGVYDNASLYALFLKWFGQENQKLIFVLLASIIFFLAAMVLYLIIIENREKDKLKWPEVLDCSILLIFIPLLSPLGWYYTYLFSMLAIMILINYFDKFPKAWKYVLLINFFLIGGSLYEILGAKLFRIYTELSIVTINYLLVVISLFYLRFKRYC